MTFYPPLSNLKQEQEIPLLPNNCEVMHSLSTVLSLSPPL